MEKVNTNVTSPKGRLSFPNLFVPKAFQEGQEAKYGCQLLLKKGEPAVEAFIKQLKDVMQFAVVEKWPDPKKRPTKLMSGLKDGDTWEFDQGGLKKDKYPEYAGHYVISANGKKKPLVVDQQAMPITNDEDVYAGCWIRIQFNAYANDKGKFGVFFGLRGVQKMGDAEAFGGGSAKFDPVEDQSTVAGGEDASFMN
jgi:hypothetical protein